MEMFLDQKPDKKQTYNAELTKNGGLMDTAMYQYIMTNTAESYRIVGAILALITGVGALLAGYVGYKQKKA